MNIVATTVTNTATMEPGSSCMDESTLEECKQSDETTEHISENELKTEGEERSSIVPQDDNSNLPKETIEEEGPGAQALKRCFSQPQINKFLTKKIKLDAAENNKLDAIENNKLIENKELNEVDSHREVDRNSELPGREESKKDVKLSSRKDPDDEDRNDTVVNNIFAKELQTTEGTEEDGITEEETDRQQRDVGCARGIEDLNKTEENEVFECKTDHQGGEGGKGNMNESSINAEVEKEENCTVRPEENEKEHSDQLEEKEKDTTEEIEGTKKCKKSLEEKNTSGLPSGWSRLCVTRKDGIKRDYYLVNQQVVTRKVDVVIAHVNYHFVFLLVECHKYYVAFQIVRKSFCPGPEVPFSEGGEQVVA